MTPIDIKTQSKFTLRIHITGNSKVPNTFSDSILNHIIVIEEYGKDWTSVHDKMFL